MENTTYNPEEVQKLHERIKDVKVCMLTTSDENGTLRSRPMAAVSSEPNGTIWFFTKEFSQKVDEINVSHAVNLSYSDPGGNLYVSVSGDAAVIQDKAKMEQLWNPFFRAWFPEGLADPSISLLKVDITKAEYWEASANKMVQLFGMVKAMVTGKEFHPGKHEKINL